MGPRAAGRQCERDSPRGNASEGTQSPAVSGARRGHLRAMFQVCIEARSLARARQSSPNLRDGTRWCYQLPADGRIFPTMKRRWKILAGVAGAIGLLLYCGVILPFWGMPFNGSRHGRVPLTPPWALECWLWEDDTNTAAAVNELLTGYAAHDIPVRTVMIDSPWSERYNDFKVDEIGRAHV